MMICEVDSEVISEEITFNRDGVEKKMTIRYQYGQLIFLDHRFPIIVRVGLRDGAPEYAPGFYFWGRSSFQTEREKLDLAYQPRLLPANPEAQRLFNQLRGLYQVSDAGRVKAVS
jgi:hypothetical protein